MCPFVLDLASVSGCLPLDQDLLGLSSSHGLVFDAFRNDEKLVLRQIDVLVAQFDRELSSRNEEEFVFLCVSVPYELASELDKLHLLIVQLANYLRRPKVPDLFEALGRFTCFSLACRNFRGPLMPIFFLVQSSDGFYDAIRNVREIRKTSEEL